MPVSASFDERFFDLPVVCPALGQRKALGPDVAARLVVNSNSDGAFGLKFEEMLASPGADELRALVIGLWGWVADSDSAVVVTHLVSFADRLPALEALFVGDIAWDEAEISWIQQSDLSPLWAAFPKLRFFGARGGDGLRLGAAAHPRIETLILESGAMPSAAVREAAAARMPELTHFEIWTGSPEYGADSQIGDLAPLLSGEGCPKLKTLAIRNCAFADDVAIALAGGPLLERLDRLDFSMGALGDDGAEALLAAPAARGLKSLDLTHNFLTAPMRARLEAELGGAGVALSLSGGEDGAPRDERFVAVSE